MIALWIYIGGVAGVASLIAFEVFDGGITGWTLLAPFVWPLLLPSIVVSAAVDRLRAWRKRRESF